MSSRADGKRSGDRDGDGASQWSPCPHSWRRWRLPHRATRSSRPRAARLACRRRTRRQPRRPRTSVRARCRSRAARGQKVITRSRRSRARGGRGWRVRWRFVQGQRPRRRTWRNLRIGARSARASANTTRNRSAASSRPGVYARRHVAAHGVRAERDQLAARGAGTGAGHVLVVAKARTGTTRYATYP